MSTITTKAMTILEVAFAEGFVVNTGFLTSVQPELLSERVRLYKELCQKREQYRHPKDKELTDFDRTTMLNAAVAEIQAEYELVAGLETLVRERIAIIKLLMELDNANKQ